MAIPDRILRKPGPLTDDERTIMRTHCDVGYNMLIRIPFLREAAEIVLSHQEYYDGTGYPRGLRGEDIPLGARIFAVADALDAMISDRPYRKALSIEHARAGDQALQRNAVRSQRGRGISVLAAVAVDRIARKRGDTFLPFARHLEPFLRRVRRRSRPSLLIGRPTS